MTEETESCNDYEYSNEYDLQEAEVDKLNNETFGDEKDWNFHNLNVEIDDNDCKFEHFPFDEFEIDNNNIVLNQNRENDLLGLKGSLFNFGTLKNTENNRLNDKSDDFIAQNNRFIDQNNDFITQNQFIDKNNDFIAQNTRLINKHDDFEIAMEKLDLLDSAADKTSTKSIILDPFEELNRYSAILHVQFQNYQKSNNNSQFLNGIVAKHLNFLSKKLSELNLPMDCLSQLKYFRLLTNFVAIDNRINEIHAKFLNDPRLHSAEMSNLIHEFSLLLPEQQVELAAIHPFYSSLSGFLRSVAANGNSSSGSQFLDNNNYCAANNYNLVNIGQSNIMGQQARLPHFTERQLPPSSRTTVCQFDNIDREMRGWMTDSEREWMMKVQTRNLIADNPYVHDYYYTKMKLKEMTEARNSQLASCGHTNIPDPLSLLPSPITADQLGAGIDSSKDDGNNPQYQPIQFANSLGRLTACNINTPRQTIQILPQHHSVTATDNNVSEERKQSRSHRELLSIIEKVHCTVLRVDEVDKSLAKMLVEQHHSRTVLLHHRQHLLHLIMSSVNHTPQQFTNFFSLHKGARILLSVFAVVSATQFLQLIRSLFFNCVSLFHSTHFLNFESDFKSIIVSRVTKLAKEELSLLITTFFSSSIVINNNDNDNKTKTTIQDNNNNYKLQSLSVFCSRQFGLYVVLTVLDAFFKISPEDKANINKLLEITLKSVDTKSSSSITHKLMKDFHDLFSP